MSELIYWTVYIWMGAQVQRFTAVQSHSARGALAVVQVKLGLSLGHILSFIVRTDEGQGLDRCFLAHFAHWTPVVVIHAGCRYRGHVDFDNSRVYGWVRVCIDDHGTTMTFPVECVHLADP